MVRNNIMASKPQACSITAILAVLHAIFLHNSLKLFLTGSNQAFNNVKGSKPNAAAGKKWKDYVISVGAMTIEVETKDKNQFCLEFL